MEILAHNDHRAFEEPPRRGLSPRFERLLLLRSLGLLREDSQRCADCRRTPLAGERVHEYERTAGVVCELCRPGRSEAPQASILVRHSERGRAVKPLAAGGIP